MRSKQPWAEMLEIEAATRAEGQKGVRQREIACPFKDALASPRSQGALAEMAILRLWVRTGILGCEMANDGAAEP